MLLGAAPGSVARNPPGGLRAPGGCRIEPGWVSAELGALPAVPALCPSVQDSLWIKDLDM